MTYATYFLFSQDSQETTEADVGRRVDGRCKVRRIRIRKNGRTEEVRRGQEKEDETEETFTKNDGQKEGQKIGEKTAYSLACC